MDARSHYAARTATLERDRGALDRASGRISALRGVTFLGAVLAGLLSLFAPEPPAALAALGWVLLLAFVVLVVRHAMLLGRRAEVEVRLAVIRRALDRLDGRWTSFAEDGAGYLEGAPPFADDLDLFGKGSLFQLLDTSRTGHGEATLARWLLEPASVEEVARRQEAARELLALPQLREDLEALGDRARRRKAGGEALVRWAERTSDGLAASPLVHVARVLVASTLVLGAAASLPGDLFGPARAVWLLPLACQVLLQVAVRARVEPIVAPVASRDDPFVRLDPVLARLAAEPFSSAPLRALAGETAGAREAVRSLRRLASLAEVRHNGLLHFVLNTFLVWDLFCAASLDRWRARHGAGVRVWLRALGELEALAGFGTLAFERPSWSFPRVDGGPARFSAEGLGHPLLPEARRVDNDVAILGPGHALLVTGSNMSGKSTLLRAIGVNAVLALAGAPVCARRLELSPVALHTSLRIRDSIEEGVSRFYAELSKLKRALDAADAGAPVLFLFDEILGGTNSRERHAGARAVIEHLLDRGALGAFTTHDLELAAIAETHPARVRVVHFQESVEDDRMTFDYRLRPGLVRSSNALRLMRLIGIDVPVEGD